MIERRLLRFESIAGIKRNDLPIAAEIWLEDLVKGIWITRDVLKLATLFTSYIKYPNPQLLAIGSIERNCGLDKNQVTECLRAMQIYGAVVGFTCDGPVLKASLSLSYLQRLKVLETRLRFSELQDLCRDREMPWHVAEERWLRDGNVSREGSPTEDLLAADASGKL